MSIRVGRWDCPTCGNKMILGPETACNACGSARPQNVRFYLPDDAQIVEHEEELRKARAGADWVCGHCGGHNKAFQNSCQSCGNERSNNDGDKQLQQRVIKQGEAQQPTTEQRPAQQETQKKRKGFGCLGWGILGLVVVVILFFLIVERTQTVTVQKVSWQYAISYENYRNVTEEDWTVPQGGTVISSFDAIHHYDRVHNGTVTKTREVEEKVGEKQVKTGVRDLGNGYFEDVYETQPIYETRTETYQETVYKEVPVYKTKYKFKIDKWIEAELTSSGNDKNPRWNDSLTIIENNSDYRLKDKREKYTLWLVRGNDKPIEADVPIDFWQSVSVGDNLDARYTYGGSFRGLKALQETGSSDWDD